MKYKILSIALAAVSFVVSQSGTAEAGYGCRTYYRPVYRPVTIVQPVVHQPVVVQPVVTHPVVVAVPTPAPAPIFVAPKAIKVPQGAKLRLKANFLGKEPGQVFLATGSVTLACEVLEWNPNFVNIQLPNMAVVKETAGKIVIVTNEGALKRKVEVIVMPTPDVEVIASDDFIPKAPTEVLGN
jgi:hypothetical protein